jgi:toxin CptA
MERGYVILVAFCVLAYSAWRCRRELRQLPRQVLIPPTPSPVLVDGAPVTSVELLERGPLTLLRWRVGNRRDACVFWPDTLNREQRRELRLAVRARAVSRGAQTVAP